MKNKNKLIISFFIFIFVSCFSLAFLYYGILRKDYKEIFENKSDSAENASFEESKEAFFGEDGDYPVFVVFDNHPDSRPYHSGYFDAPVVYEYLAEGGATRYAALFEGAPSAEKIGPIRSARPYVVETAAGWGALFLHAGGSPEALEMIESGKNDIVDLNEISGLGPLYFWRDTKISRPHNLFTSGELVGKALSDFELKNFNKDKISFLWEKEGVKPSLENGDFQSATSVYIDFSQGILFDSSYKFDSVSGLYLRSVGGIDHKDSHFSKQISPANVVVQKIPPEEYYPSGLGRIKLEMIGEGEAIYFQKGKVAKGYWKKESKNSPTKWFNSDGSEFVFAIGQTWVEIVPGLRTVTYE